jgi:hypothetical protein
LADVFVESQINVDSAWKLVPSLPKERERVNTWAELLARIAPGARSELFDEAWLAARHINDPDELVTALTLLVPYAPAERLHACADQVLKSVQRLPHDEYYEDSLASVLIAIHKVVAPVGATLTERLAIARAMHDVHNRAVTLASLVPHVSAGDRQSLFDEAVRAAHSIQGPRERALVFTDFLLPVCPERNRASFRLETIRVLAETEYLDSGSLDKICRGVGELAATEVLETWSQSLDIMSGQGRDSALQFLAGTAALFGPVFGRHGSAAAARAIVDIGRWFPPR